MFCLRIDRDVCEDKGNAVAGREHACVVPTSRLLAHNGRHFLAREKIVKVCNFQLPT